MSRKGVLLLKDEVKKEYEVLPKGPKGASKEESKPLLTSKPMLPHLSSSSCCDIPVVFSSTSSSSSSSSISRSSSNISSSSISSRRRQGQPYSISKNLLSAISPWLASLIQGASLVHSVSREARPYFVGDEAGTGLSLPDTSASVFSSYISACLSPSPLPMTPELLEVHSLLNPCKGLGSLPTEEFSKEVEVQESFDESLPVLAMGVAKILQKQKQDNVVIKSENYTTGSKTKAKIKDVGEGYTNDESKKVPFCEVCGKIFKKLRWLEHHMRKHLTESEEKVPCKESEEKVPCKKCGKDFSSANLDCHQHIIASKPKLIKCKLLSP